jgi:hypothetical protein
MMKREYPIRSLQLPSLASELVAPFRKILWTSWILRGWGACSDRQGFWNPCGLRVGYAGVGVRVGLHQPSAYPDPWCGLAVYPPSRQRVFAAEFDSQSTWVVTNTVDLQLERRTVRKWSPLLGQCTATSKLANLARIESKTKSHVLQTFLPIRFGTCVIRTM